MSLGLTDFLDHMRLAAADACGFVSGMRKEDFVADKRTQNAVGMSLVVAGEPASRIMERHPDFAERHPHIDWRAMRGMRNRIAHGYFDINLDLVWETTQPALPALLQQLPRES